MSLSHEMIRVNYEILCKFPWSEKYGAHRGPVEVRLSVTCSSNCNEAEALERRVQGHVCAQPTHILGNLLWGTTQTLEGVRNPYTEAVRGLSVIDAYGLKYLWSRTDMAEPPNGRCDTAFLCSRDLKYSLRRGTPNAPHATI